MTTPFFETLGRIDELVTREPKSIDFGLEVVPLIQEEAARKYFFEHVEGESWLDKLRESGVFDVPPAVTEDGIACRWYPSEMLVRLAPEAPIRVFQIMHEMPQTDNPNIHNDILRACQVLAPERTRHILKAVSLWYQRGTRTPDPELVALLATKWLRHGYQADAIMLLGLVLDVSASRRTRSTADPDRLQSSTNLWQYEDLVERQLLPLAAEFDVISELLTNLLHEAVVQNELSRTRPSTASYLWQPSLTGGSGRSGDLRGILAQGLFKALRQRVAEAPSELSGIVRSLDARGWDIFRRISLELLTKQLATTPSPATVAEATSRLTSMEYLHNFELQREFVELLNVAFPVLPQPAQAEFLGLLERGPMLWRESSTTQLPSGELREYRERWILNRLAVLDGKLPTESQERLAELRDEYGVESDLRLPYEISAIREGSPSSPKIPDFAEMQSHDVVAFLLTWDEDAQEGKSTRRESVARSLRGVVAADAITYSQAADEFLNVNPEFTHSYLLGLDEAIREKSEASQPSFSAFAWPSVLTLCEELCKRSDGFVRDDVWKQVRGAIVNLLTAAFGSSVTEIPHAAAEQLWRILSALAEDADPTPEAEEESLGLDQDPYLIAINSVRGRALEAVVQFGLWRHRSLELKDSGSRLEALHPGLQALLEQHLDVTVESSVAIRSVYGRWYPWLILLDEEWASEVTSTIFPEEPRLLPYWKAAFSTYVRFCPAYDAVLPSLIAEYRRGIAELGEPEEKEARRNLPSHLMTFYWRGKLDLEDGGLMDAFFRTAAADMRASAVEFIGRSLANTKPDQISEEVQCRLMNLWSWRLERMRENNEGPGTSEEAGAFLSWYPPGHFDEVWALKQLLQSLELGPAIGYRAHRLFQRLSDAASIHPRLVAEVTSTIVTSDQDPLRSRRWYQELEDVISTVLASEDAEAKGMLAMTIDSLGRQGALQFRKFAESL